MTLDYELGELRLGDGRLPEPDVETVFDARSTDERPWLDVTFPRGERRMLIDSGANSATLSLRDLGRYATQAPPRASGAVLKINRVERSLSARAAGEVLLGAFALPAPVLDETRGTELIGAEVMRHFHWTFDPVRQRVRIERRTAASALAFDPLEDHGLVLVPETEGNSLRVHEVIPETAAAESGVRPGDRVVAIDGRPVRARGCDWTKGRTMALTLDRDGERLDVEVPMTRFVD